MSSSESDSNAQSGARGEVPPTVETPETPVVSWHISRLFVAWGIAAIIGVLVTLFANGERAEWLALAVGISVLVTFALQLGTAQREGFISRLSFSIAGSVVVIAVIDVIGMITESVS